MQAHRAIEYAYMSLHPGPTWLTEAIPSGSSDNLATAYAELSWTRRHNSHLDFYNLTASITEVFTT